MRMLLCSVTIGMLAAAAAPAQAQVPPGGVDRTILIAPPPTPPPTPLPPRLSTNPDLVVQRILSFDADGDARVTAAELPDRMQAVVDRVDVNKDGFLTQVEIRSSVDTRITFRAGRVIARDGSSGVEGVVNDLKLPPPKREQALAIVKGRTQVRNINEGADGDVYARLRELLDDEEYENFEAAAKRLRFQIVVRSAVGGVVGGQVNVVR